jgi:hypothetical protein
MRVARSRHGIATRQAGQRPIKPSQFYLTDGTKPIAVLTAWPTSINFWLAGLLAVWPSDL